ncbi:MAG: hypothetical protein JXC85_02260 [Candidatus Aenigmarchaeota archaeon]|nr:hypothetical protein [Candidatus Aenigmarchaeota archaeon]
MVPQEKSNRKLQKLYSTVPGYEAILDGVRVGRGYFEDEVTKRGIGPAHSSSVHPYGDVEVQAFALSIPNDGSNEIIMKSMLTYGAHFIDDFLDSADKNRKLGSISANRSSPHMILDLLGDVGGFGRFLASKTTQQHGFYKAVQRMAYGGLIQLSEDQETQSVYLDEHKGIALRDVAKALRDDVAGIRPVAYWMTTKAVQELFFSAEPQYDPTLAEAWTLFYCPALYCHNAPEEERAGELQFQGQEKPMEAEMVQVIEIGTEHIKCFKDERLPKRITQAGFVSKAFEGRLPDGVSDAYKAAEGVLRKAAG